MIIIMTKYDAMKVHSNRVIHHNKFGGCVSQIDRFLPKNCLGLDCQAMSLNIKNNSFIKYFYFEFKTIKTIEIHVKFYIL